MHAERRPPRCLLEGGVCGEFRRQLAVRRAAQCDYAVCFGPGTPSAKTAAVPALHPLLLILLVVLAGGWPAAAAAAEVTVAVAGNFAAPMREIATGFERETGHRVLLSAGGTGKLYAQIKAGAPFDLLLAADDETPLRLESEGDAVAGSRFTYAVGGLVLWSRMAGYVDDQGAILKTGDFRKLALANPRLAPYGAAATEVLTATGALEAVRARLVTAENIAQAQQFVASGNAELGFVARSQVLRDGKLVAGSAWLVPPALHEPIRQDAAVLQRGRGKPAVAALVAWLKGDAARAVIRAYGYLP